MLAVQMVTRLESVHNQHFIHGSDLSSNRRKITDCNFVCGHRDVKPDNFVMGLHNTSHMVYVIDLGV